jgi:hypothetical protein
MLSNSIWYKVSLSVQTILTIDWPCLRLSLPARGYWISYHTISVANNLGLRPWIHDYDQTMRQKSVCPCPYYIDIGWSTKRIMYSSWPCPDYPFPRGYWISYHTRSGWPNCSWTVFSTFPKIDRAIHGEINILWTSLAWKLALHPTTLACLSVNSYSW